MSFFSRKPNPPTPPAVSKALGQQAVKAPFATPIPSSAYAANPVQGGKAAEEQPLANTRFRSFAERYIVERCRDWKEGEIDERTWEAILQAKSIYNKVREVSRTLGNDS